MREIFKNVPGFNNLKINHDGSIIYNEDKLIHIQNSYAHKRKYKVIQIKRKKYSVAKLVYKTFVYNYPIKKITYFDGNTQNTHYKNLGPKPFKNSMLLPNDGLVTVAGFDDVKVNTNGTIVTQHNLIVNVFKSVLNSRNPVVYNVVCVNKKKGEVKIIVPVHKLVAIAFLGVKYGEFQHITHLNGDNLNNHYLNLKVMSDRDWREANKFNLGVKSKLKLQDVEQILQLIRKGESLKSIAKIYNTSDMSISRVKHHYLTKSEIDKINKKKNINTYKTPKQTEEKILKELKNGDLKQIEIAKKYNVTPHVVCRVNKRLQ